MENVLRLFVVEILVEIVECRGGKAEHDRFEVSPVDGIAGGVRSDDGENVSSVGHVVRGLVVEQGGDVGKKVCFHDVCLFVRLLCCFVVCVGCVWGCFLGWVHRGLYLGLYCIALLFMQIYALLFIYANPI